MVGPRSAWRMPWRSGSEAADGFLASVGRRPWRDASRRRGEVAAGERVVITRYGQAQFDERFAHMQTAPADMDRSPGAA